MKDQMNYLRELLSIKEKNIQNEKDKEKVENLKFLLSKNDIFFELDINTAIGILAFLGIEESKIKDFYYKLISPQAFVKSSKPYISTGRM